MICKNCGASIKENVSKCPHCGAMIYKVAFREYRKHLYNYKDKIDSLDDDGYKTLNELVIKAILSSIFIVFICIIIGIASGFIFEDNTYNDEIFNQDLYQDIIWTENNFKIMDELYDNQEYDILNEYINQNPSVCARRYHHYDIMMIILNYQSVLNSLSLYENSEKIEEYIVMDILDILYYEKIARNHSIDDNERMIYDNIKNELYDEILKFGLDKKELEMLFNKSFKDGYINRDKLELELGKIL